MRPRTVGILVACGVIALVGGWFFGTNTTPVGQETIPRGQLAFPDLAPKLQKATKIEITHQGTQTVIDKLPSGTWGVAELHNYPVQEAKLRAVLTALTELRLTEMRTSDPSEFARLGVDDPNSKDSSADLLQVVEASGRPIAALIVGHRRVRGQIDLQDAVYVRRPDENQSWLAEGNLQIDADPTSWLDRSVMNIGHNRIASVVVGDNALVFGRPDGKFTLTQPADHPKLEDYKVDNVARALELLSFQQVRDDKGAPGAEIGHSVFTTTDGLAINVTVLQAEKHVWARFGITGSDKARAEADALHAHLAGWTYEIGSWKEKSLMPTLDDLKAPEPAKPSTASGNASVTPVPGNASATPDSGAK